MIVINNYGCAGQRRRPSSKFFGVSYHIDKRHETDPIRPWRARYTRYILGPDGRKYGREINLGYFKTEKKAARAVNKDICNNADVNIHSYKLNVTKGI